MNRAELISAVAEATGQPKTHVSDTLAAVVHTITGALAKGHKVTLVGFGTFDRRQRQARTGRNPRTMDVLKIPAARVPAFRPGLELKQIVNGEKRISQVAGPSKKAAKPAVKAKVAAKKPVAKVAKKTVKKRR